MSVHDMSLDCKREAQNAKKEDLIFLYQQSLFYEFFNVSPRLKAGASI
jgi:hypothetical protein